MLTKNFYKLATVQQDTAFIRQSDTSTNRGPFIDIINANGKIICTDNATNTEKYERVNLGTYELGGYSDYGSYRIASLPSRCGSTEGRFSVTDSGQTRTIIYFNDAFNDRDNNVNSDTASSYCTMGAPTMYLGNGTTNPTKDDYTMESCLTNYTVKACNITHNLNDGIIIISFSILPNEDLQLSEIGIFTDELRSNGRSRSMTPKSALAMVCHDVFTPVTLPANKTTTITYTIDLSKLTAETTIG